jgi:TonB family protein
MRVLFTIIIVVLLTSSAALAKNRSPSGVAKRGTLDVTQAQEVSAYTPAPEYPLEARRRYIGGSGMFRLIVQVRTGLVSAVEIERSTGSAALDTSAMKTLRHWRFKPVVLQSLQKKFAPGDRAREVVVRVPLTFEIRRKT